MQSDDEASATRLRANDKNAWRSPPSGSKTPLPRMKGSSIALLCLVLVGIAALSIFLSLREGQLASPDYTPYADDAKKSVADKLLDPASAQFRDVKRNVNCVSGFVNGKNAFGGYTGFKEFIYDPRSSRSFVDEYISSERSVDGMADHQHFLSARTKCLF